MLDELGYEATSINEGLAVVYGELEDSNYTGIGISCGGGLCNVCLAYLSVPVLSFSIPKAGDYIDYQRRAGDRRARQSGPLGQGRFLPLQRLLRRQDATGHRGVLRRHDPFPGRGHARGLRQRPQPSQSSIAPFPSC